jgi:hypothetical protein
MSLDFWSQTATAATAAATPHSIIAGSRSIGEVDHSREAVILLAQNGVEENGEIWPGCRRL